MKDIDFHSSTTSNKILPSLVWAKITHYDVEPKEMFMSLYIFQQDAKKPEDTALLNTHLRTLHPSHCLTFQ